MSTRLRGGSPSPARESKGVIECSAGEPRPGKGRRRLIKAALNDTFAPLLFSGHRSRVWRGKYNACWELHRSAPTCTARSRLWPSSAECSSLICTATNLVLLLLLLPWSVASQAGGVLLQTVLHLHDASSSSHSVRGSQHLLLHCTPPSHAGLLSNVS